MEQRCAEPALSRLACSWCAALLPSHRIRLSTSTNTRTPHGESAKGFLKAYSFACTDARWLPLGGHGFWLVPFDGVRAVLWEPPAGERLPGAGQTLARRARRTLWIGTLRGLASWKAGQLTHYPELEGQTIEALLEDGEGTIWAGGWVPSRDALHIQGGAARCDGRTAVSASE